MLQGVVYNVCVSLTHKCLHVYVCLRHSIKNQFKNSYFLSFVACVNSELVYSLSLEQEPSIPHVRGKRLNHQKGKINVKMVSYWTTKWLKKYSKSKENVGKPSKRLQKYCPRPLFNISRESLTNWK